MINTYAALVTAVAATLGAGAARADEMALPDPMMTPGAVDPTATLAVVCAHDTRSRRRVKTATRDKVLASYNVPLDRRFDYEIDHLIPLALGGSNDAANLWPQPNAEAERKDALEIAMQDAVCAGKVPLAEAQREIADDWVVALRRYLKEAHVQLAD